MQLDALLETLFPRGHTVRVENQVLHGQAQAGDTVVSVIGTTGHLEIGVEHALALSAAVLESTGTAPERPIVMLVDTAGQRPSRGDELLGINGYLGHLAQCLELARRRGARLIALVYGEAVSGGFLSFGLMADRAYALADAQVRVMDLRAMARVTKQPLERLQALSESSPVFAPGAQNYAAMGAVQAIWEADLADRLVAALAEPAVGDERRRLGRERGGRTLAADIADRVARGEC